MDIWEPITKIASIITIILFVYGIYQFIRKKIEAKKNNNPMYNSFQFKENKKDVRKSIAFLVILSIYFLIATIPLIAQMIQKQFSSYNSFQLLQTLFTTANLIVIYFDYTSTLAKILLKIYLFLIYVFIGFGISNQIIISKVMNIAIYLNSYDNYFFIINIIQMVVVIFNICISYILILHKINLHRLTMKVTQNILMAEEAMEQKNLVSAKRYTKNAKEITAKIDDILSNYAD